MRRIQADPAVSRRRFFLTGLAAAALPLIPRPFQSGTGAQLEAQDSLAGRGATGTLRDPTAVGRSRPPTDPRENDPEVQSIEHRLACNCGCTLDVFTCRTTDFSCTYSPALHREVLALRDSGKTAQEILEAFVSKYGEKALMAPKPQGFNLAGYLLPGGLIAAAAAGLALFIGRRKAAVASSSPALSAISTPTISASQEELDRLQRALADIED